MSSKSQRTIYSGFSSLSLLLKERQIKIARSDMNRENKERVNSLGHRTCVSLQQRFVALTKQRFGFGMSSRLLLYSQDPRACFSQPQTLVVLPVFSAAHPDIIHFLSKREIPCPNFLIPLLLGILEEPAWTLFIVLKVSSHEMAQSGSDISQTT